MRAAAIGFAGFALVLFSFVAHAPAQFQPPTERLHIKADTAWKMLSGRFPEVAALQKSVVSASVGGKSVYRLRAVGSSDQTRAACRALKAAGENCLPVN